MADNAKLELLVVPDTGNSSESARSNLLLCRGLWSTVEEANQSMAAKGAPAKSAWKSTRRSLLGPHRKDRGRLESVGRRAQHDI